MGEYTSNELRTLLALAHEERDTQENTIDEYIDEVKALRAAIDALRKAIQNRGGDPDVWLHNDRVTEETSTDGE